jgi:hypothetical protein
MLFLHRENARTSSREELAPDQIIVDIHTPPPETQDIGYCTGGARPKTYSSRQNPSPERERRPSACSADGDEEKKKKKKKKYVTFLTKLTRV